MTYKEKVEAELEQAFEQYQTKVEEIAERVRQEKLIPYLKKYNYGFLVGMGMWTTRGIDSDDVPKRIAELLDIILPGINGSLGEMMSDYGIKYKGES